MLFRPACRPRQTGQSLLVTPAFRLYFNKRSFIPTMPALFDSPGWWLAPFFFCSLLLPPLPFPIGDSGVHIAPLFALLGLLTGFVRADKRQTSRLGNLFLLFLGILMASVAFAAMYSGWRIALGSLARVLLFGIGVYVFFVRAAEGIDLR